MNLVVKSLSANAFKDRRVLQDGMDGLTTLGLRALLGVLAQQARRG